MVLPEFYRRQLEMLRNFTSLLQSYYGSPDPRFPLVDTLLPTNLVAWYWARDVCKLIGIELHYRMQLALKLCLCLGMGCGIIVIYQTIRNDIEWVSFLLSLVFLLLLVGSVILAVLRGELLIFSCL